MARGAEQVVFESGRERGISELGDGTPETSQRPSILIVDDQLENLVDAGNVLATLDVDVFTARSGSEALGHCLRQRFAVILMEVEMQEMDGYQVADLLANHKKTRSLPIIFLTHSGKKEPNVYKGYKFSTVDYLFRPVEPEIFIAKVSLFLALESQRIALARLTSQFKELDYRHTLLMDSIATGVLGFGNDGIISFVNLEGQRLLLGDEGLVGSPILPVLEGPEVPADAWIMHRLRDACVNHTKITASDTMIYSKNGTPVPVVYSFSPVAAEAGATGGMLVFQEITCRK